tara:strand:- start:602 stop:784 length:183 start_codon:yes stop_codon:yes gene_type:complete
MKNVSYELDVFPELYEMIVNTGNYVPDKFEINICRFCNETNPKNSKIKHTSSLNLQETRN